MMKKIKIAITGGIGAGKSFVSAIIEKKGFVVLHADSIAKELILNDSQVQRQILKEFGKDSFIAGKINTKYLGEKIFTNEENLQKINAIVHPATMKKIDQLAKKHFEKVKIVFVETALVFEANLEEQFDHIILVYADEKLRMERILAREKISEAEIRNRMNFQIPDEEKKDHADFVIENNSTIEDLEKRCAFVLTILTQLS
jgi:dephospho-CoA kinase